MLIVSSSPWKRSIYSCCLFPTCPCCVQIGLCSHIVFDHLPPWTLLLPLPQPYTVQRGLVAAFAHKDIFTNHEWKPWESSVSFFGGNAVCRSQGITDNVKNQIVEQLYFITLCLCSTESFWSLQSLTVKTPVYTILIILLVAKQSDMSLVWQSGARSWLK